MRLLVQDTEAEMETMVPPDVVERHLDTIESLKKEIAKMDKTHKHLILRYSTLKSSIEQSFKASSSGTSAKESLTPESVGRLHYFLLHS